MADGFDRVLRILEAGAAVAGTILLIREIREQTRRLESAEASASAAEASAAIAAASAERARLALSAEVGAGAVAGLAGVGDGMALNLPLPMPLTPELFQAVHRGGGCVGGLGPSAELVNLTTGRRVTRTLRVDRRSGLPIVPAGFEPVGRIKGGREITGVWPWPGRYPDRIRVVRDGRRLTVREA